MTLPFLQTYHHLQQTKFKKNDLPFIGVAYLSWHIYELME